MTSATTGDPAASTLIRDTTRAPGQRPPASHRPASGDTTVRAADMRRLVLEMIYRAQSGHAGSSLSCVDIISVLKFDQMRWSAAVPRSDGDSDVFILSKGHAAPAWYAALMASGELDPAYAGMLRIIDSPLQGHPDRQRLSLVDASTGALGQGLSMAIGRAEAKRLKQSPARVFCIVGDGELQEGQCWEALMYAGARELDNLILIVDYNKRQSDGLVADTMPLEPLADRLSAFGWHVQEIDGHDHAAIRRSCAAAHAARSAPSVVIAHTSKGRLGPGRVVLNGAHGGTLDAAEYQEAVAFLGSQ